MRSIKLVSPMPFTIHQVKRYKEQKRAVRYAAERLQVLSKYPNKEYNMLAANELEENLNILKDIRNNLILLGIYDYDN